jgi:hypothetical protein
VDPENHNYVRHLNVRSNRGGTEHILLHIATPDKLWAEMHEPKEPKRRHAGRAASWGKVGVV